MAKTEYVQSVLKALDILEAVTDGEQGIRLNEIADRLNLKTATAHNLIRTLVARDYLYKSRNQYMLGRKVEELVEKHCSRQILQKMKDTFCELSERYPDAVVTATEICYSELVIRLRVSPDRPGIVQQPTNHTFTPYGTMTGLVCLALAGPDTGPVLARYPFDEYGIYKWKDKTALELFLEKIRENGYAAGDFDSSWFRAAVPVFNAKNQFMFSIGLSFPDMTLEKAKRDNIVSDLLETAAQLVK